MRNAGTRKRGLERAAMAEGPDRSTIWKRFTALPPHRRVLLGVAGMAVALVGLLITPDEAATSKQFGTFGFDAVKTRKDES